MDNIYGLIGRKLSHSFSPQIHNIIFDELNLKGSYNIFETAKDNLEHLLVALKKSDVKGINVTLPYKTVIMKYLNNISPEAQRIGAINTIKFKDEILEGHNTDYIGFGASLKNSNIEIKNKVATILGTGGASKAVSQYLIDHEISNICFVSRNPNNILSNTSNIEIISYDELKRKKSGQIIINCTPCGMYPHVKECPANKNIISRYSVAIDLIYNPMETVFIKYASELGLNSINGLYMLIAQAIASEEIWHNTKFDQKSIDDIYTKVKKSLYL